MNQIKQEIPKYLKQKESDVSKEKKKSKHKHQYEECLMENINIGTSHMYLNKHHNQNKTPNKKMRCVSTLNEQIYLRS